MKRLSVACALTGLLLLAGNAWPAAPEDHNEFARNYCAQLQPVLPCVRVVSGETWDTVLPDIRRQLVVQKLNRQNTKLKTGQWLIIPPADFSLDSVSPFPEQGFSEYERVVVFAPNASVLGWALYEQGERKRWGPAVGGADSCSGRRGSCHTSTGLFRFLETANERRRSAVYPKLKDKKTRKWLPCAKVNYSKCAPMAYFNRFTQSGQGLHARDMNGSNASHGCVGAFADDALFVNQYVRSVVGKSDFGYLSKAQVKKAPYLLVLPYEQTPAEFIHSPVQMAEN